MIFLSTALRTKTASRSAVGFGMAFLVLLSLIGGCQSLTQSNKSTAIVFATDAPSSLPQIKKMLAEPLLNNKDAEYATTLERKWHAQSSLAHNNAGKAKIQLSNKAYRIKKRYQRDRKRRRYSRKTANMAWRYFKEAQNTLMTTYEPITDYTDLLFWSSIVLRKQKKRFNQVAPLYGATTSSQKVRQLERTSFVPASTIQSIYLASNRMVTLTMESAFKCEINVNGNRIESNIVKVPRNVVSIVTANCGDNGLWSRSITPTRSTKLRIKPESYYAFNSMPNPLFLSNKDVKESNPWTKKILFVYYSGKTNKFLFKGFDIDTMSSLYYTKLMASPKPSKDVFFPKVSGFVDGFIAEKTPRNRVPQERVNIAIAH